MPISFFCLLSSADSSFPTDQSRKCQVRACPFLTSFDSDVCPYHDHFFAYPRSLTGRSIALGDIYRLDKDDPRWPTLSVQPTSEVFWRPYIRVVMNGEIQRPRDPYKDKDWGSVEATRRFLFAEQDAKPMPGKPSRLSTAEVIQPNGSVTRTVERVPSTPVNSQHTGAFVLWKGFGKKKIRKSQRMRPQGWHGNHPEQKPHERWGTRETINDLPAWTPPAKTQCRVDRQINDNSQSEDAIRDIAIAELADENWTNVFASRSL